VAYRVHGLDCAEEVAVLRKAVGRLPGVLDLEFDILNARMTVSYAPDRTSAGYIEAAVAEAGMKAVPWTGREVPADDQTRAWRRRLVTTCLSGGLLVAAFLTHWHLHGSLLDALTGGAGAEGHAFPLVSLLLYAGAIVTGAWHVAPRAVGAARRLRPDMNLLMMVAVAGAVAIGQWSEAATVAFLFALALLLEQWSVGRARRAISDLLDLTPATARYVDPEDGHMREERVERVPVGAVVLVRPGERIPLDGEVVEGRTSVNQAPITGESAPVGKDRGDEVYAGTINGDGAIRFRATRPAEDTTLARIIHMVEQAHSRRAPAERWVDRFARYYTPAMMALAAAVAVLPPLVLALPWGAWVYRGLVILVIACPCALVISTPVSIVSGLASAARSGVLIKGGAYLEAAGRLKGVALDKTGTLTAGRPEVQRVVPFDEHTPEDLLRIAAALEASSGHPLARAILRRARQQGITPVPAEEFRAVEGKGAEGVVDGERFWIGSHRMMDEKGQETPLVHKKAEQLADAGHSVVAVGTDEHVCGLISVGDGVRPQAPEAVSRLRELGVERVLMLTGDNEGTARAVAGATGVDEYRAELLPVDKVRAVESLAHQLGDVAMVGDGVNDAPAMAAAGFGVAMGAMGSDAAIETADVALMADDLSRLPWLLRHSRRVLGVVRQNVAFALGLKLVFIVLAFAGLATLWMAIAADMGASLLVTFNGLRLLRGTP
jgi:Cd2+/Zn2+-exporting ATPase